MGCTAGAEGRFGPNALGLGFEGEVLQQVIDGEGDLCGRDVQLFGQSPGAAVQEDLRRLDAIRIFGPFTSDAEQLGGDGLKVGADQVGELLAGFEAGEGPRRCPTSGASCTGARTAVGGFLRGFGHMSGLRVNNLAKFKDVSSRNVMAGGGTFRLNPNRPVRPGDRRVATLGLNLEWCVGAGPTWARASVYPSVIIFPCNQA
jgi:hypothetical protein